MTIDGPCHLYTSSLFNFIRSDSFIKEYYTLNGICTPNFLSHYVLSLLFNFFNQGLSEKIFICFYFVAVPLTFRKAIQLYSKNESNFSLLIFPIVYSYLLHMGFYNFNLAFVFFNIHLILLYFFINQRFSWYKLSFYVINTLLLYYSHAFMFVLALGLSFFIVVVYSEFKVKIIFNRFLSLLAFSILPLFLIFFFFVTHKVVNYDSDISALEKLRMIITGSPIIVTGVREHLYICVLLVIIGLLSITTLYKYGINKFERHVFLFFALLIFITIFFVSNGMFTGMLIDRLALVFFYITIFWLSCFRIDSKWIYLFCASTVLYCFLNLYFIRKKAIGDIGANAKKVFAASHYLAPHSFVYNINLTKDWREGHFGNYLANNKPVVFINDNHASLGWFPFKWKNEKLIIDMCNNIINYDPQVHKKLPDYILVLGDQLKLNLYLSLKKCIDDHGTKIYSSKDNYCVLYELK